MYVKGIPLPSNILSKRSKEEAREGKDESSGEQLQLDRKKGQSMGSCFENVPLTGAQERILSIRYITVIRSFLKEPLGQVRR